MSDNHEKKRVDVLLAEYRACHMNRNHYDSIKWSISSILMAASFALFGVSFVEEIKYAVTEVILLTFFSLALMLIAWLYIWYLNPFVDLSLKRLRQIEQELQKLKFDAPKLHTTIHKKGKLVVFGRRIRGRYITYSFLATAILAWSLRILLLFSFSLNN